MSAHLRSIVRRCRCGRKALVELLNTFNAPAGEFCKRCGNRELALMLKHEQTDWNKGVRNDGRVAIAKAKVES